MRFVVSTVGTSILTNLIDGRNPAEATWRNMLGKSANFKQDELAPETKTVIDELANRSLEKLLEDNVQTNRRISAELNGVYGIYEGRLPQNSSDQHYLICTDTAQGQKTGELIQNFLKKKSFTVNIFTPSQLSTKNTEVFATGTKELIKWLENTVRGLGSSCIIFNLVGGFKSLQGYMQTFGAFYADEIVYIFEGSTDLIRIPRLPIQIDTTVIKQYRGQLAMMADRAPCPSTEITGVDDIPETLVYNMEDCGQRYVGLSAWGELIWNRTKEDLLKSDTLLIQEELKDRAQVKLALMAAGKLYPRNELRDIPEVLLEFEEENGVICAKLSVWGQSIWNETKKADLLAKKLLPFPRLQYSNSFIDNFTDQNNLQQRRKLQETLAKVVYMLDKDGGSTAKLKADKGLKYERYKNVPDQIDHFRFDGERRVSCKENNGSLILRKCGAHDFVNDNP